MKRLLRRFAIIAGGAIAGLVCCAVLAAGLIRPSLADPSTTTIAFSVGLVALMIVVVVRRLRFVSPSARAKRVSWLLAAAEHFADIEVSLMMVAGAMTAILATGGASSPLYPLIYGIVAFAATMLSPLGAAAALIAALGIEGATAWRMPELALSSAIHAVFLVGAVLAHALILRGLIRRLRARHARSLFEELDAQRASARDYRLISSALGPTSRAPRTREEEQALLAAGGAQLVGESARWIVEILKRCLEARTVGLFWLDGDRLKRKEIVSDAPDVTEQRFIAAGGMLGAVIRDRAPVLVAATKPGQLPYYEGRSAVGAAFVGVPVMDGPHLRGVLCADRDRAFRDGEREMLDDACAHLLRTVQAEQVFFAVERAKYEHERFYQAAAMLGRALTPEQVMETAFDAAGAICEYDVAAITLYDRERGRHRVASVRIRESGLGMVAAEALLGLEFRDNAGLAAMVVKNRHYLPAGGEPREVTAPVFTRKIKLDEAKSLVVVPLLSADEAIGTLTLASRSDKRFSGDVREMLSVIANLVAVSLQNGLLYKRMETMATTDGLTGLTNHRSFQERFGDLLERAGRHGHKVAVLLCDVDFFKKVNDTYGHPAGDEVLRRVAKVLAEVARKIDVTARYGGEEFAVVLENADAEQARQVGERIRQEIGRLAIETEKGPLSVTMSIGVASFPEDGRDRAELIEHADHALYHAKHSGRNQVVTYVQFCAQRHASAQAPRDSARLRAS